MWLTWACLGIRTRTAHEEALGGVCLEGCPTALTSPPYFSSFVLPYQDYQTSVSDATRLSFEVQKVVVAEHHHPHDSGSSTFFKES